MSEVKERPILFSAPMVRAILNNSKTQTRRIVKEKDYPIAFAGFTDEFVCLPENHLHQSPYGTIGEKLWVRETFCSNEKNVAGYKADALCGAFGYDGDGNKLFVKHGYILDDSCKQTYIGNFKNGCNTFGLGRFGGKWKPSIFMPKWLSRIQLEITNVRVERLNDISETDVYAEGIDGLQSELAGGCSGLESAMIINPIFAYSTLWESINGAGSWTVNPWVWVIEFKRIK